ncbi:MAG: hypothetical protein AMXMBFR74_29380 [Parvibaculum sp.]|uniref:restriction endonuclease subunit S n=1 Tax=Parvibaculum sp. TaxID=2024848 RepID=UPI0035BA0866
MDNAWAQTVLGAICRFQAGDAFGRDDQGRTFGDHPFIKVSDMNLVGNEIYISRANNWVSDEEAQQNYRLHPKNAVVFAKIGIALTYNRRRRLVRPTIIDNNMMSAVPTPDVDPVWFYYLLSTIDFNLISSGSALPYLTVKDLSRIEIEVPPNREQQTIASVLGALDNKIELNRRMNETLEAMARAIFKDWFVDFGPTRAKMAMRGEDPQRENVVRAPYLAPDIWSLFPDRIDDEGRPEGWEVRSLDQIAHFLNGLALQKYPDQGQGSLPVIKIAQLRAGHADASDRASTDIPESYVVEDGDLLFSWSGSLIHRIWTGGRGALNQHLFKVTSDMFPKWFVFYWIGHHMPDFQATAASKATTMGHIQRHHLTQATAIVPSDPVMTAANELVSPIFNRMIANDIETRTLASTRDLLLPKLMSGEIRVREAEKIVGEVV